MMGKVIMSGIVPPLVAPITGILASDLAVGSVVKLMENGVATEYLVVNQGKPSGSSLYDDTCDGTWLLRKDIKEMRQWHSSEVNNYANSTIHSWLNADFFNLFGSIEQSAIKQVKIPYVNGSGTDGYIASGFNGLSAKIFLLSGYELGWTQGIYEDTFPIDGDCLSYFIGTSETDSKRIGYLNGTANNYWTRSPYCKSKGVSWCVWDNGGRAYVGANITSSYGIRPALVLPSNALFDTNTLILKGVA